MDVMEITPVDGQDVDVTEDVEVLSPDLSDGDVSLGPSDEAGETVPDDSVGVAQEILSESDSLEEYEEIESQEETESQEELEEADGEELFFPSPALPEGPLPVYLVDAPEEEEGMVPFSISGSPYPGTISTSYLDYFEGIADKLSFTEHYVAFRASQYEYLMAWGEGLQYDGYQFKGSALSYCRIYTGSGSSNMKVTFGSDTVYLTPGTGLVYSDLDHFASLTEGGTHLEFSAVLFVLGFTVVYNVCHDLFDYVMQHVYRK